MRVDENPQFMKKNGGFLWLLIPLFFLAGMLNGLAGAGGGMVTALGLPFYFKKERSRNAFAYTALAVLLFSTVSLFAYSLRGDLSVAAAAENILPALVGGAIGGVLLTHIRPVLLKLFFALLLLYSGVRFMFE